jgi:hypothetical protein
MFAAPTEEIAVPLPIDGAKARVQVWGNTSSEGRFEVVVDTPKGSERRVLWEDWGPAQRTSLYFTPSNWLVVLGGGGRAEMISLSSEAAPRCIPYLERPKQNGEGWRYLGAVDRHLDRLIYYAPSLQDECIPLYGAGSSPYRKEHQDEGSCSRLCAS